MNTRPKILYFSALYKPYYVGGAERITETLAQNFMSDFDVVVVSTTPHHKDYIEEVDGVRVYRLSNTNRYWGFDSDMEYSSLEKLAWHTLDSYNPGVYSRVRRILDNERPNLVHSHSLAGLSVSVWRAAKSFNIPIVHTLHDYSLICPRTTMFRSEHNCKKQCAECMILSIPRKKESELVDCVIGVSRFVLDQHIKRGYFASAREAQVVHNGNTRIGEQGAPSFQTPNRERLTLGFLGRLSEEKGIKSLLEVHHQVADRVNLLVGGVGESNYVKYLKRIYSSAVIFLDYVQPKDFYPYIDALVVPSLWNDPFPTVAFEAYSYGIPTIGRRRGGIPDIINKLDKNLIFETSDELIKILRNLNENIKSYDKNKVLRISEYFKVSRFIEDVRCMYKSVLN